MCSQFVSRPCLLSLPTWVYLWQAEAMPPRQMETPQGWEMQLSQRSEALAEDKGAREGSLLCVQNTNTFHKKFKADKLTLHKV